MNRLTVTCFGVLASLSLALSGCSPSVDDSLGSSPDFVPAEALEGVWVGELSLVRSDGPEIITRPVLELEFGPVNEGLFKFDRRLQTASGDNMLWEDGLGSVGPHGETLMTEINENQVMRGYFLDENTMVLQIIELSETGLDREGYPNTFAGLATLTKQE